MDTGKLKSRKAAFTLVELLVVVSVIALLAALLMPAIQSVQQTAKISATRTEVNQLQLALNMYFEAFGEYPPDSFSGTFRRHNGGTDDVNPDNNFANLTVNFDAAQCLVFFLSSRFRANYNSRGPEHAGEILADGSVLAHLDGNGGPFYDFPDAPDDTAGRVQDYRFIDYFRKEDRDPDVIPLNLKWCYYRFDNNEDDHRSPPLYGFNVSDINRNSVDVWSSGPDGYDLLTIAETRAALDATPLNNGDGVIDKANLPFRAVVKVLITWDFNGDGNEEEKEMSFEVDDIGNW